MNTLELTTRALELVREASKRPGMMSLNGVKAEARLRKLLSSYFQLLGHTLQSSNIAGLQSKEQVTHLAQSIVRRKTVLLDHILKTSKADSYLASHGQSHMHADFQEAMGLLQEWPDKDGVDNHGRDSTGERRTRSRKVDKKKLHDRVSNWQETSDFEGAEAESAIKSGKHNEIVAGIREGRVQEDLHRGLYVGNDEEVRNWKPGQEVQIMPSSFTKDENVAERFASGETMGLADERDMSPLMLHVSGPSNGIDVNKVAPNPDFVEDKEVISGGRYRVESVNDYPGTHHVNLTRHVHLKYLGAL